MAACSVHVGSAASILHVVALFLDFIITESSRASDNNLQGDLLLLAAFKAHLFDIMLYQIELILFQDLETLVLVLKYNYWYKNSVCNCTLTNVNYNLSLYPEEK